MAETSQRRVPTRAEIDALKKTFEENAKQSPYPGASDDPADAYRHIVGMAELSRRHGFAPAYAAGILNELKPNLDAYKSRSDYDKIGILGESSQMDLHNNDIGLEIGRTAQSFEEVQQRAHAAIRAAAIEGGTGKNGTARFLSQEKWSGDDKRQEHIVWPVRGLAQSSEVESILGRPPETWSEDEVQKVMRDRIYWDTNHPRQAEAFEAVRRAFEHRQNNPARAQGGNGSGRGEAASGGPVNVRSYTRDDGTKVDAHSRSAPALHGR